MFVPLEAFFAGANGVLERLTATVLGSLLPSGCCLQEGDGMSGWRVEDAGGQLKFDAVHWMNALRSIIETAARASGVGSMRRGYNGGGQS